MSKKLKLTIIIPRENDQITSVISLGDNVSAGMNSNTDVFPNPVPTMTSFDSYLTFLKSLNIAKADMTHNKLDLLEKTKKEFINVYLAPLAKYVLFVANEDRYKAGLSGFTLGKEYATKHNPAGFTAKFIKAGSEPGTAHIKVDNRAGNALFIVQQKIDGQFVTIDAFETVNMLVSGLPSGTSTLNIYGKKKNKKSPSVELVVRAI